MATKKIATTPKTPSSRKVPVIASRAKRSSIQTPVLDPKVFNLDVSPALINQVIHIYQDRSHQDTHKVKTRGEVNRTTKKVYKQKGTGNARHGARSAPIYVGGGVSHGPDGIQARNLKVNKKMAAKALAGLLTNRARSNSVSFFEITQFKTPSTKSIKGLFDSAKTLIIHSNESSDFVKSASNIGNLTIINASAVNPLVVAQNDILKITSKAHTDLVTRLSAVLKK